ncbi:MAG: glycosyltransferase [Acidobacteriota bacterium]|nr:MAG: glycosyltransferase [Acidobacteriota bacterium]
MSKPLVQVVPIRPRPAELFIQLLGESGFSEAREQAVRLTRRLNGRRIWNINSTAAGGGVAEMLHTLLAYARGFGVDTRWLVISGSPEFFRVTKRLHNALHGERGDGSRLDGTAHEIYDEVTAANAAELEHVIDSDDIVILHDPQTAGLIPYLSRRGIGAFWRCHIGMDEPSAEASAAWKFLAPYLTEARAFVFSRFAYLPDELYHGRCLISAPSIDPFSPKNQLMDDVTARAILRHIDVIAETGNNASRHFTRSDGSIATVNRRADIVREGPPPAASAPLVVQVSRWDRLKDPVGVLRGFCRAISLGAPSDAALVLAGPSVKAVADDPEGGEVFEEVVQCWRALPREQRRRVHLVNLPMDDLQENAAMVNALQRYATTVVQKSLREGFGLTVTEAMWKGKPVIASAVGGIQDQIEHGVSGLLLKRPADLDAYAGSIVQVLNNPGLAARLGENARRRVMKNYLGLRIVSNYDDLVERLEHDQPEPHTDVVGDTV